MSYVTPLKDYSNLSFNNTPNEDTFYQTKRRIKLDQFEINNNNNNNKTPIKQINQLNDDNSFLSNKISSLTNSNFTQRMKPLVSSPFKPSPRRETGSSSSFISSTPANETSNDLIYHSLTNAYSNRSNISFSRSGPTGTPFFRNNENNNNNNNSTIFNSSRHTSPLRQVHNNDSFSFHNSTILNNDNLNSTPLPNLTNQQQQQQQNNLQRSIFSRSRRPTLNNSNKPVITTTETEVKKDIKPLKVEDTTVDLQSPYVEIAISRIIHKDTELKKLLNNFLFFLIFKFLKSILLLILIDIDFSNLISITIDSYYDNLLEYGKYFNRLIYCIFIYNILSSFFKLIKPQDQCLDLPLTNKQRKLLGLPLITSKEQDEIDSNHFSEKQKEQQLKSDISSSNNGIFNQSPRSPRKSNKLPDISLLTSDINRSFASLNIKSNDNNQEKSSINNNQSFLISSPDKSTIIKEKLLNNNNNLKLNNQDSPSNFSPSNRFLYTVNSPNHKSSSGFIRNGFDATNTSDVSFY